MYKISRRSVTIQGAVSIKSRSTPQPRARKRHGKSLFLFLLALLRVKILLKIAAKYLPMSGSIVVSVSPTEQGGKMFFSKTRFLGVLRRIVLLS